ncbi:MAG: formylglycine-generating enzyme family protein [Prevotellaceae bacterium]|jgi:formylglycine-generating enzyme required for sulfatase activity|nr:formylglycine-generating enzyme family protein [Prevotellaceae bacterium]
MKQNYKLYLCALLLAGVANTMTIGAHAADKPQLAVLVVGMESEAKCDELAARWAYDLNRDSAYKLLTKGNSGSVGLKFNELSTQLAQGKPVDTTGIAKWGRDQGIALVQLVVQDTIGTSPMENIAKRVAWLVDCNTGKLSGRGTFRLRFPSPPYLENKANKISLVGVRGGVFEMGCKAGRDDKTHSCSESNALPLQEVAVSDFKIGKYEVTQGVWRAVMKETKFENYFCFGGNCGTANGALNDTTCGAVACDPQRPVEAVSWYLALAFCNRLSEMLGKTPVYGGFTFADIDDDGDCTACNDGASVTVDASANGYRLPTSKEWEYAARGCEAGSCENFEYSGSDDLQEVGWNNTADAAAYASGTTHPVGQLKANGLGIYDMSGNVWEWCWDSWDIGSNRVIRGDSWYNDAADSKYCVAARRDITPRNRTSSVGFRVVLP